MKFLNNNKFKAGILFPLLLAGSSSVFANPPQVLASIKPLQLISQAITEGVTDTKVLLPPGASPHNYHMRPSDARKLRSAEVVFWVGPAMESFLERNLSSSEKSISVTMMDIEGIKLRKSDDKAAKTEVHAHEHNHEHGHEHNHGEYDPHIWLSSDNGRAIAKKISNILSDVDKEHAAQYQKNLALFLKNLDAADKQNQATVNSLNDKPLFVFHDAYGYLQEQYHLNIAGHFTLNPEQQPGAKHLTNLRAQLKTAGDTCIFREPQFQPAYIDRITQDLPVKIGVLDPLGENIKVQPDGYPQFINSLVDNIDQCLHSASKL
ncbi:hypothetical protein ACH42_13715 [Endozoicomonas sp. (ex Bugula neritina AB1)]|nr:hypothetical protein ACH42_13715 [Endozoicomonas sp. (ex Bugula neritina AB1)]